jgi:hypothetical protein
VLPHAAATSVRPRASTERFQIAIVAPDRRLIPLAQRHPL